MNKKDLKQLIREAISEQTNEPLKEIGNSSGPYDLLTPIEQTLLVNALNKLSKKDGGAAVTHESLVHTKIGRCVAALKDVVANNPNLRPLEKEVIGDLAKKLDRFEKISKIKKTTNEGLIPNKESLPQEYKNLIIKLEEILSKRHVSLDNTNIIVAAVVQYLRNNGWEATGTVTHGGIHEAVKNKHWLVALDRPGAGWSEVVSAPTAERARKIANARHKSEPPADTVHEVDPSSVKPAQSSVGKSPEYIYYEDGQVTDLENDSFAKDYIEGVASGEFKGAVYKKVR